VTTGDTTTSRSVPALTAQMSGEPCWPPAMPGWMWRWLTTYWLIEVGVRTSLTKWLPHPPRYSPGPPESVMKLRLRRMCGKSRSLNSAWALMRLPMADAIAPHPSTPSTAFTHPALTSPPWSKNGRPVRGSLSPYIWRGLPNL
jgi:hypothetical protein